MKTLIFLLLLFTFTASAQTVDSTVIITQKTADACAAAFIESKAKDTLLDAKNSELKAVYALKQAVQNESAAKDTIIDLMRGEIEIFRKTKCQKFSILFGLISSKKCF